MEAVMVKRRGTIGVDDLANGRPRKAHDVRWPLWVMLGALLLTLVAIAVVALA